MIRKNISYGHSFYNIKKIEIDMKIREISRSEIGKIWTEIDRSEFIHEICIMKENELTTKEINFDAQGWDNGSEKTYAPILEECFDSGGYFLGAFNGSGKLCGISVLENRFNGNKRLQLKFLHISKEARKTGLGGALFKSSVEKAREKGAEMMYISSCENKNTVEFYKHMGCFITNNIDKELYKLEPLDIHMEYKING